jgi:predicted O-linked N-acetylglucosamine transferase (SPINDLY family)
LERFVAQSKEQYVDLAADLIRDAERLDSLRSELRDRLESSPVMRAEPFARDLEAAFADMWRTWCESKR